MSTITVDTLCSFLGIRTPPDKAALDTIMSYNGSLENNKILKRYKVGKKKREIIEATPEYTQLLRSYRVVLKHLVKKLLGYKDANYNMQRIICMYQFTEKGQITEFSPTSDTIIQNVRGLAAPLRYTNKDTVWIKYDISKAFPSTKWEMTRNLLRDALKVKKKAPLNLFTDIDQFIEQLKYLFIDNGLPQGFLTSPIVFGLVQSILTQKVFDTLMRCARGSTKSYCKCCYEFRGKILTAPPVKLVRYVDDFLLELAVEPGVNNCRNHYNYVRVILNRLYGKYGYLITKSKFQTSYKGKATYIRFVGHSITGNNVKRGWQLPERVRNKISCAAHNKDKITDPKYRQYAQGMLAYANSVKENI